jgi:hypothetical protein
MTNTILARLTDDDDPELWRLVVDTVLSDLAPQPDALVQIGRCSHWLAPHQYRWQADGGFACPMGYGAGGFSLQGLPEFDWSAIFRWTGEVWEPVSASSVRYALRLSIPSRTRHHRQAAVHSLWMTGKEKVRRFYGFRNRQGAWQCTAISSFPPTA